MAITLISRIHRTTVATTKKGGVSPPPGRHENLRRHMPHRPAAHAVIMFYIRQFSVCRTGAQSQSG